MNTELIQQQLKIKNWPLEKIGDAVFFGYVVSMGNFIREWGDERGAIPYVDFQYGDNYERYRLPDDENLKKQLFQFLWDNINGFAFAGDIYGKVWVYLKEDGYLVTTP